MGTGVRPGQKEYYKFLVARPQELHQDIVYPKESSLIEDVQSELRQGRRCQIYATYTGEKDVNGRLEQVLSAAGLRVAVLRASVPTQKREEWYDRQLESGVEVVVCHPKLVETGLDLLAFPTLYFYQTGYSLHTLRQASRRSWRIGQRHPVRVKFLTYKGTMQEICLRLMGRKMLVALMMEGKFSGEGLQSLDADEDLMAAMARELVEKAGVGESADQIWRQLDRERAKHVGPAAQDSGETADHGTLPQRSRRRATSRAFIWFRRLGRSNGLTLPRGGRRRPPNSQFSSVCSAETSNNQQPCSRGEPMCEERAKIRCVQCELVQWADQANCRRCGKALPAPIVNVVERVVEKVVIQQDSQCLENLLEASKLISATAAKLQESRVTRNSQCTPGRFRVSNRSRHSMRWSAR